MELGISNIAWPPNFDHDVAEVLKMGELTSIDVAPSKYFDLQGKTSKSEVTAVRKFWESKGLQITGMQSLMFGSSLNLFDSHGHREDMLNWLDNVCFIGRNLGAQNLVFGSPKNRNREGLTDQESFAAASDFFLRLGDVAVRHGVKICLEPNPREYGANFLVSNVETARFVDSLYHPAVRMQVDTGALALDAEGWGGLEASKALIGHVHLSAPRLIPLFQADGHTIAQLLRAMRLPGDFTPTIEMLTSGHEVALTEIERSIDFIRNLDAGAFGGLRA